MKRGSRKHILDWVARPYSIGQMNELLNCTGARIDRESHSWMPTKEKDQEARLETNGRHLLPERGLGNQLTDWWLEHHNGANTPNWDFAASCTVRNKQGLVLVEAKAHEDELDWGPKRLDRSASSDSKDNHKRIGDAIEEARKALNRALSGTVAISRDCRYQLSNRVAYAWKLASLDVPVVLAYLGFLGDTYFNADYLRDADHWQRVTGGYMQGVVPLSLPGTWTECGKSAFTLVIRSRPVLEISPPGS